MANYRGDHTYLWRHQVGPSGSGASCRLRPPPSHNRQRPREPEDFERPVLLGRTAKGARRVEKSRNARGLRVAARNARRPMQARGAPTGCEHVCRASCCCQDVSGASTQRLCHPPSPQAKQQMRVKCDGGSCCKASGLHHDAPERSPLFSPANKPLQGLVASSATSRTNTYWICVNAPRRCYGLALFLPGARPFNYGGHVGTLGITRLDGTAPVPPMQLQSVGWAFNPSFGVRCLESFDQPLLDFGCTGSGREGGGRKRSLLSPWGVETMVETTSASSGRSGEGGGRKERGDALHCSGKPLEQWRRSKGRRWEPEGRGNRGRASGAGASPTGNQ